MVPSRTIQATFNNSKIAVSQYNITQDLKADDGLDVGVTNDEVPAPVKDRK